MRDIVATIQPEQDELVRADRDVAICVLGAPGTGNPNPGFRHTEPGRIEELADASRGPFGASAYSGSNQGRNAVGCQV